MSRLIYIVFWRLEETCGLFSSMNLYKYLYYSKTFLRTYVLPKTIVITGFGRILGRTYSTGNFDPAGKSLRNYNENQLGLRERVTIPPLRTPRDPRYIKEVYLEELVQSQKSLTVEEWECYKAKSRIDKNFESQVMVLCAFHRNTSLGMSLMNYVESKPLKPNLVTLSKYLKLLSDCKKEGNNDTVTEEMLISLYSRIMDRNKNNILDSGTAGDVIRGICQTSRWREAIPLLDHIKITSKTIGTGLLMCVAGAALRHGDYDYGWELLDAACTGQYPILDEGFNCWMEQCKVAPVDRRLQMLERMLHFLRKHELSVSEDIVTNIKSFFESNLEQKWTGQLSTVSTRGICKACGSSLESITLEDDQFARLRDNFINRVIEGNDIFLKTTPQELEKFKEFVQKTAPYTVVMDALNVAYAMQLKRSNNAKLATQLLTVVQHFARTSKSSRILVLGKQHMTNWPKSIMNAIKQEAFVFFVDNISKDDPFLLYAALFSGQGTYLISKDMMRDHIYCLQDPELAAYFRKWQKGHQIEVLGVKIGVHVNYKPAIEYNPVVQQNRANLWHVPYGDGNPKESNESPCTWLCVKREESDP